MTKTLIKFSVCLLALSFPLYTQAQVTIGSGIPPVSGALLDLKEKADGSSTRGLGLPRVELKDIKTKTDLAETMGMANGTLDKDEHIGLVVYNVGKDETSTATRFCPGVHIWDGDEWQSLTAYPAMSETRVLQSSSLKGFTHLNPNDTTDPMWSTLGKNPTDYPIGYMGVFTDNRPNDKAQNYHYSRFYVGYTTADNVYDITRDYSCAQDGSKILTTTETITGDLTFEDGVWMTEHLRATRTPNGGSMHATVSPSNYKNLYYNYPNRTSSNLIYGGIYNFSAAMNNINTGYRDEEGLNEGAKKQGICPDGWHLPSDRQWTDLENAIIINTSRFSNLPDIGISNLIPYNTGTGARGVPLGEGLKSQTNLNGKQSGGGSNSASTGGFDALLTGKFGHVQDNTLTYFGENVVFWTSSTTGQGQGYCRSISNYSSDAGKGATIESSSVYPQYFSVRCKKD